LTSWMFIWSPSLSPDYLRGAYFAVSGDASPSTLHLPVGLSVDCVASGSRLSLLSSLLVPIPMHMELLTTDVPWLCLGCNGSATHVLYALNLLPVILHMSSFASRLGGLFAVQVSTLLEVPSLTCSIFWFVLGHMTGTLCLLWSPDATMPISLRVDTWLHDWTYACTRGGPLLVIRWSYRVDNGTVDRDGDLVFRSDWSPLCVTTTLTAADCSSVAAPWKWFPNQGRVSPRTTQMTTAMPTWIPPWRMLRWMIRLLFLSQYLVAGCTGFVGSGIVRQLRDPEATVVLEQYHHCPSALL